MALALWLKGTIKSEKFIALLNDEVLPYIVNKFNEAFTFQQGNAPLHANKMTNNFLKTLVWPTHSSYLSPLECVWKMVNGIVYTKSDFQNVKELWKNIQNAAVIINAEKGSIIKKIKNAS